MSDKVKELADKIQNGGYYAVEGILRDGLEPLLKAGEKLLLLRRRGSDFDADRAADEFRAKLQGWTARNPDGR